jgi:hypothetical protein
MSPDDAVHSLNHSVTHLEPSPLSRAPHCHDRHPRIPHIVHRPPSTTPLPFFWIAMCGYRRLHISAHCGRSVLCLPTAPRRFSCAWPTISTTRSLACGGRDAAPGSVRMISARSVQAPLVVSPIPPSARKSESLKFKHPQLEYESKVSKSFACGVGVRFVCWFGTECD